MADKSLRNKAILIKGKKYVLVKDRIIAFNKFYPNGAIKTELVSDVSSERVVVKAQVTPDIKNLDRYFTGYSQAVIGKGLVNQTAALENAETSAVGRALAMLGIGVIDSVASVDEMKKAGATKPTPTPVPVKRPNDRERVLDGKKCPYCGATGRYHKPGCPNAEGGQATKQVAKATKWPPSGMKQKLTDKDIDEIGEKIFSNKVTAAQAAKIFAMSKKLGFEAEEWKEKIKTKYKLASFNDLSKDQASELISKMVEVH